MAFIFPASFAKCRNGSILYDKETAALRTGGLLYFVFGTRGMVDLEGLEPLTSRMRTERSPN